MSHRSRRTHLVLLVVTISLIYLLFFSSESSSTPSFRTRTESAIARSRHSPLRGDLSDEDLLAVTNARLSQIIGENLDTDRDGVVVLKGTRTPPATPDTTKEADGGSGGKGKGKGKGKDKDVSSEVNEDGVEEIPIAGRKSMPKAKDGSSGLSGTPPSSRKQAQQQQWEKLQQQQRQHQQALKDKDKPKYPKTDGSGSDGSSSSEDDDPLATAASSDPGEIAARQELQSILKKAPIIIFSKSYCPYSRRAKQVLLHDYDIVPKPYVVELDQLTDPLPTASAEEEEEEEDEDEDEEVAEYDDDDDDDDSSTSSSTKKSNNKKTKSKSKSKAKPKTKETTTTTSPPTTMGRKIQDLLKSLTGRSTVPNIMIASQSIGGSDEIVDLHNKGKLAEQIRKLAGKRIVSVEPITTTDSGSGSGSSNSDSDEKTTQKKNLKETKKKRKL